MDYPEMNQSVPTPVYYKVESDEDLIALVHTVVGAAEAMPLLYNSTDKVPMTPERRARLDQFAADMKELTKQYANALEEERQFFGELYQAKQDGADTSGYMASVWAATAIRMGYSPEEGRRLGRLELTEWELGIGKIYAEHHLEAMKALPYDNPWKIPPEKAEFLVRIAAIDAPTVQTIIWERGFDAEEQYILGEVFLYYMHGLDPKTIGHLQLLTERLKKLGWSAAQLNRMLKAELTDDEAAVAKAYLEQHDRFPKQWIVVKEDETQ